jgi:hypothetical protein
MLQIEPFLTVEENFNIISDLFSLLSKLPDKKNFEIFFYISLLPFLFLFPLFFCMNKRQGPHVNTGAYLNFTLYCLYRTGIQYRYSKRKSICGRWTSCYQTKAYYWMQPGYFLTSRSSHAVGMTNGDNLAVNLRWPPPPHCQLPTPIPNPN